MVLLILLLRLGCIFIFYQGTENKQSNIYKVLDPIGFKVVRILNHNILIHIILMVSKNILFPCLN